MEEKTITKQTCKRCNKSWWPRKAKVEEIRQCPFCKSTLWNKERVRNVYNRYTEEKGE